MKTSISNGTETFFIVAGFVLLFFDGLHPAFFPYLDYMRNAVVVEIKS